jgi:membrane protease YdiL (CAAX protease family)
MQQGLLLKIGVWICAAWAFTLAVLAFVNLLYLVNAVELYSDQDGNQAQVWIVFVVNVGFGLAFAISIYGLWRRQNWGRLLFLWTIVIWSGFNFMALFAPGIIFASDVQRTVSELTLNGVRFAAGVAIPLLFLNLPRVKALFYNEGS